MVAKVKSTVECPLCEKEVEVLKGETRTQALNRHLAIECSARPGGIK